MIEIEKQKVEAFHKGLLPYLGIVVLFLGVFRSMLFYYFFGINIVDYLELGEIISSFLDVIVISAILFFWSLFQRFLQQKSERLIDWFWSRKKPNVEASVENSPVETKESRIVGVVVSSLIFVVFCLINRVSCSEFLSAVISLFGVLLIIHGIYFGIASTQKSSMRTAIFSYVYIIGGAMLLLAGNSIFQVYRIQDVKKYVGTTITFNDKSVFVSDSQHYYIGKTENYLFIHNQSSHTTDAYPMSAVSKLHFAVDSMLLQRKLRNN